MAIEIRPITADELIPWQRHIARAFGRAPDDARVERVLRPHIHYEDTLGAFDGDEIVGTAHHEPAPLTLPGGAVLPCAGVTRVSVASTHRRRGVLTEMMRTQLRQAYESGNPLAALWASESPIYGRFGYGLASIHETCSVDRRDAGFAWWAPDARGAVRFVSTEDRHETLRPLFEAYAASRPGGSPRIGYRWDAYFEDAAEERGGASPLNAVLYESPTGEAEGYLLYRLKPDWPDNIPAYVLTADELVALTPTAYVELWRYLLSVDLVGTVEVHDQPVDAPIPWVVADFRRLKRRPADGLYLRVLDVPRALVARRYGAADRLALELDDAFCPWAAGRYVLDAGAEGAAVTRTEAEPDLVLRSAALGTLLLGAQRASVLAAVGLADERTPGALARADALFRVTAAPHCLNHF